MSRHGEYDFPAPPPMSGEFECIPLHDQTMPVTEQPERIFIGQPDRTPRIQETSQKGQNYGGHEGPMSPSYRSDFMPPQYRQEDNRLMRDNSIARGTGQSQTMPRPVQQQPISHTEPSRPMQKYSRPSSLSAEPNMQRQTAKQDQYRPPPVAQKPGQRPVFNYLGQSNPVATGIQRQLYPQFIKPSPRNWSSGLCSCCSDIKSCCGVFWCGCFFYPCFLSKKLGEHTCLPCIMSSTCSLISLRTKLRTQARIDGTVCSDCCTVVFCQWCAMCQMSREHDFATKHRIVQN